MSALNQPPAVQSPLDSTSLAPLTQVISADYQEAKRASPLLWGLLPIGLLMLVFFLIPLAIMVLYSLWRVEGFNIVQSWTLDNYSKFFTLPAYTQVLTRTFVTAVVVTLIALISGYPFAYFLVRYTHSRWQRLFLILVILPFWTSYLLRVYAWMSILGDKGLINQLLMFLGIIDEPIRVFLYNQYAVVIVFLYLYVPFAIITIYASLEKFDFTQISAAADLGATPWQAFWHILLPQTKAGVITAYIYLYPYAGGIYYPETGRRSRYAHDCQPRRESVQRLSVSSGFGDHLCRCAFYHYLSDRCPEISST
jgi:spermidine/putrescine transport system permease protein